MKVSLNLANAPSFHERYALTWSVPTVFVALIVLTLLGRSSWANYQSYRATHAQVEAIQRQQAELEQKEARLRAMLERPQYQGTYREVQFLNSIIAEKQLSLPVMVQQVTALLPAGARLEGVSFSSSGREEGIKLDVVGRSDQDIEKFLGNLEESPNFADPSIGSWGGADQRTGGIAVSCHARYIGAGAEVPAEGPPGQGATGR